LQLALQFALQLLLAKYFGAAEEMDAYVAASALPIVLATILSGSLGYVLVPMVAQQLEKHGRKAAATVASQIGLYLLGLSLLITAAVIIAARPLASALFPGFQATERELAIQLLRVLALLILLNNAIAYLNGLFHAYGRFAAPAIAGVAGTLATLSYVLLLHEQQGIYSVAWGAVAGAGLAVAMLLPLFGSLLWQSASWRAAPQAATRRCAMLLTPLVLGAIFWRLEPLLDRWLGSYLPAGSISHLGYAWRLASGLMLVGTSGLSIVAFPAIAAHAAAGRKAELNAELAHAIRLFLFLLVPVCIGVLAVRLPLVELLFERGKFTAHDKQVVAKLLMLYVGAVFGAGLNDLLSRTFYARHDMLTPVLVSTAGFTLAAALKIGLTPYWGTAALAAATSVYYAMNCTALTAILLSRLGTEMLAGTLPTLVRATVGALAAYVIAIIVLRLPGSWAVVPAGLMGAIAYLIAMWLFGDEFARKIVAFKRSA